MESLCSCISQYRTGTGKYKDQYYLFYSFNSRLIFSEPDTGLRVVLKQRNELCELSILVTVSGFSFTFARYFLLNNNLFRKPEIFPATIK